MRLLTPSMFRRTSWLGLLLATLTATAAPAPAEDAEPSDAAATPPQAIITGTEPGWRPLTGEDFAQANCDPETWNWSDDGVACTGRPIGVLASVQTYTNFELMLEWRHLTSGGNSGVFVWASPEALADLPRDQLPRGGIEVQVLDHGYTEQFTRQTGEQATWFTTHGDVFPVGTSTMTPFPPISPRGDRSFPRLQLSRGVGEWNHYYVRCLNGEVRLWVNGTEVSGGTHCEPRTGRLCLESEGAPVEFRKLRIRELP